MTASLSWEKGIPIVGSRARVRFISASGADGTKAIAGLLSLGPHGGRDVATRRSSEAGAARAVRPIGVHPQRPLAPAMIVPQTASRRHSEPLRAEAAMAEPRRAVGSTPPGHHGGHGAY